jgi:hypothetical protein
MDLWMQSALKKRAEMYAHNSLEEVTSKQKKSSRSTVEATYALCCLAATCQSNFSSPKLV